MKAGFTRFVARVEIAIGILIYLFGVSLALLVILVPVERLGITPALPPSDLAAIRVVIAIIVIGTAMAIGTPAIMFGQLVLVFLEMRARLRRIDRRLRRRHRPTRRESRLTDRLRPR